MDSLEEVTTRGNSFVQHVFNFDTSTKGELLNIVQYSLLAILPIFMLNKSVQEFIPEADEEKGSIEIVFEVLAQLVVMFFGMFFIHRIVTYLPTYSGKEYGSLNIFTIIIAFLVILLSLQSRLGEKVEILYERITELWGGGNSKKNEGNEPAVRVKQPIANGGGVHQPSRADMVGQQVERPIQAMPAPQVVRTQPQMMMGGQPPMQPPPQPQQQFGGVPPERKFQMGEPNYPSMFQEPMAANEAFGGFSGYGMM